MISTITLTELYFRTAKQNITFEIFRTEMFMERNFRNSHRHHFCRDKYAIASIVFGGEIFKQIYTNYTKIENLEPSSDSIKLGLPYFHHQIGEHVFNEIFHS